MNTPDFSDGLILIINIIIGIIVFWTLLNIAARLKKLSNLSYFDFLQKNNLKKCYGCNKYYNKDLEKCPACGSDNTYKSEYEKLIIK